MDLELDGRTALIVGASSGLGLASAEALREEGANIVMFARREELLGREAARLGASAVVGDVHERRCARARRRDGGADAWWSRCRGPEWRRSAARSSIGGVG